MPNTNKELLLIDLVQPELDKFINNLHTLIQAQRIIMPQVFMSYAWPRLGSQHFDSEKDIQVWLSDLYELLSRIGITVLFDIKSMALGANIDKFMQEGIANSNKILVIGTPSYKERSQQETNVKQEVLNIQAKVATFGLDCIIPLLYCADFTNAFPVFAVGNPQVLGTNLSNAFLYHENLPTLLQTILSLHNHPEYLLLKKTYIDSLNSIKAHGLSDDKVKSFTEQKAQQIRLALQMRQEGVILAIENSFTQHPDYHSRPAGTQPLSFKAREHLQSKYQQHKTVSALFGKPMPLEGQYINVQMLYQLQEKKSEEEKSANRGKFKDTRMTSFETIFSQKQPLEIAQLFLPARQLLKNNQKTNESNPDAPPRLIILQGRAGIGKTTFINFVSAEWSSKRLWTEYDWLFTLRFRDLRQQHFVQANERGEKWSLMDWIYEIHFAGQINRIEFESLWRWLIEPKLKEKVLFLLDGYDEIPESHPCEQALATLLNSQANIILTSRPYGLSDLPLNRRELEVVGFVDENVEKYIRLYFGELHEEKTTRIISALKANPVLWGNAHIPVTINVLCGVLENTRDLTSALKNLESMSGLYETMEIALLERAYRTIPGREKIHANQLKSLDSMSKSLLLQEYYQEARQQLAQIAYKAFAHQQLVIPLALMNQILRELKVPLTQISATLDSLISLGLLKPVLGEDSDNRNEAIGYEFLHLTFQEYYASCHLVSKITPTPSQETIQEVAQIKLNPRYQIVFWFTAGAFKEVKHFDLFMRTLAHPQGSDILGHYLLGLLLRCTEENWQLAQQSGWTLLITQQLQKRIKELWSLWQYKKLLKKSSFPAWVALLKISSHGYMTKSGAADLFESITFDALSDNVEKKVLLEFIDKLSLTTPLLNQQLADLICTRDTDKETRNNAASLWKKLEQTATLPIILERLATLMADSNNAIKSAAIEALGFLGPQAATPFILEKLALLLTDEDQVYYQISWAINRFGKAAATPAFLEKLLALLSTENYSFRATRIIENFEGEVFTPSFLEKIASLLALKNYHIQDRAAWLVNKLSIKTATPTFLEKLTALLADSHADTNRAAAIAIAGIGPTAATPAIINNLSTLLAGPELRDSVAYAIGALGPAIATPVILQQLADLLSHHYWYTLKKTATAIGEIGPLAATPAILKKLADLFFHKDIYGETQTEWVQEAAITAVGNLGANAATNIVISDRLTKIMTESSEKAQLAAIKAIGKLGIINTFILDKLAVFLQDEKSEVKKSVIEAIGHFGAKALTPLISERLLEIIVRESNRHVQFDAENMIKKLGGQIATPAFLDKLIFFLKSPDKTIRSGVCNIIGSNLRHSAIDSLAFLEKIIDLLVDPIICDSAAQVVKLLAERNVALALLPKLLALPDTPAVQTSIRHLVNQLSPVYVTPAILAQLELELEDTAAHTRYHAACEVKSLGVATPKICEQLASLLLDKEIYNRQGAAFALEAVGVIAVTPQVIKAAAASLQYENTWASTKILSHLVNLYLSHDKSQDTFSTDLSFLAALVMGGYLSGKVSFSVVWQEEKNYYTLQGFVDKEAFSIKLSLDQARWLRHKTPEIIRSLYENTWGKIWAEIETDHVNTLPAIEKDPSIYEYNQKNKDIFNAGSSSATLATWNATTMTEGLPIYGLLARDPFLSFSPR